MLTRLSQLEIKLRVLSSWSEGNPGRAAKPWVGVTSAKTLLNFSEHEKFDTEGQDHLVEQRHSCPDSNN